MPMDSPDLHIRPAGPGDGAAIMEVRLSVVENALTRSRLAELGITEASIDNMLETTHAGYVAGMGGVTAAFTMANRDSGEIFALFVRPEFEGRGLGRRLLGLALDSLASAGHETATLCTDANSRAFGFYVALGWRHTGFAANGDATLERRIG